MRGSVDPRFFTQQGRIRGFNFGVELHAAESAAFRRTGGDVGHDVEGGGGMFSEFIAIVRA